MMTYEEAIEKVSARILEETRGSGYSPQWGACFAIAIAYGVDENTVNANINANVSQKLEANRQAAKAARKLAHQSENEARRQANIAARRLSDEQTN